MNNGIDDNNITKLRFYRISTVLLFIIILILFSLLVCPERKKEQLQTTKRTNNTPVVKQFIPQDPQRYYNESKIERVRRPIQKETPKNIVSNTGRKLLESFLPSAPEWLDEQEKYQLKVQFIINSSGGIESLEILKSTGLIELDDYLVKYMKKWKFDESENNVEKNTVIINYEIE